MNFRCDHNNFIFILFQFSIQLVRSSFPSTSFPCYITLFYQCLNWDAWKKCHGPEIWHWVLWWSVHTKWTHHSCHDSHLAQLFFHVAFLWLFCVCFPPSCHTLLTFLVTADICFCFMWCRYSCFLFFPSLSCRQENWWLVLRVHWQYMGQLYITSNFHI